MLCNRLCFFQRQKAERLIQLNRFASAVYHHLNVIRIQRCYRRARAMAVAKAQMDSVLMIQVKRTRVFPATKLHILVSTSNPEREK